MKKNLFLIVLCLASISCSTEKTKWTALGDSITYLNEHKNETGDRVTKGYLTRVVETVPSIAYVNKGYNGWTAVQIARKIESLDLASADVYSVLLGTNDWWHGTPIGSFDDYKNNSGDSTYFGAYRVIIDKLRKLNKTAQIILMTPMQRGDFVYVADMKNNAHGSYKDKDGQSLAEFAEAVLEIAKYEKADVIDLYNNSGMTQESLIKYKRLKDPATGAYKNYPFPEYVNIPFTPETDEYPYPLESIGMTYDGLHPSDKGNEVIAKMLVGVLQKQIAPED